MKKFNLLLMATILAFGALFMSCSEDDVPSTVTISLDAATYIPGAAVTGSITTTDKLESVTLLLDGTTVAGWPITSFKAGAAVVGDDGFYTIRIDSLESGSYSLRATDKEGVEDNASFTIAAPVSTATYSLVKTVTLGTTNTSSSLSTCVAVSGNTYTLANAAAYESSIDLIFQNGAADSGTNLLPNTTIYSPAGYAADGYTLTWAVKNQTKFDFVSTPSEVESAANAATGDMATDLAANDMVAFKTVGGLIGYFTVSSVADANSTYGGYETITIALYIKD